MASINVICPICKNSKLVEIPKFLKDHESHLITISIPKGLICDHHFQAFLDKNYKIRGYQKVDIELKSEEKSVEYNNLLDQLKIEGNTIKHGLKLNSLETIYNEFWEFISDDNILFSEFIKSDNRRIRLDHLKKLKLNRKSLNLPFENELISDINSR